MSDQINAVLKQRLDELPASTDAETRRNALKEELQYYVLNFVYHHPSYSRWIMYGGSALRIIHGLDRMSVDLDFEISDEVTENYLAELKDKLETHFRDTYGADENYLTVKIVNGRGLLLKFYLGEALELGHASQQVHVKIDLNNFIAPKTVTERRPINRNGLSFVIITYNMGALMASKLAAIFLRGERGVGSAVYEEKGRDIYDLLWYMNQKIVPDFDYLRAKVDGLDDLRKLFDKLTIKMNSVNDENLKQDLLPMFVDHTSINSWLDNWRESYYQLVEKYDIKTIKDLEDVFIYYDIRTNTYLFKFYYNTEEGGDYKIVYKLSGYWLDSRGPELPIDIDEKLVEKIDYGNAPGNAPIERDHQFATLFRDKSEAYFNKCGRVVMGYDIETKLIRLTADNLNPKEQITLNKSALLSCELDDLLK